MRQIVVTGAGTGIGQAVAQAFAECGDQVVITGRRKNLLQETAGQLGPNVRAIAFDGRVEAWNLTLAQDLGRDQITANGVAPGYIESTEFFGGGLTQERRAALIAQTADGRAGAPADIAGTVLFLASPAAAHITGQTLHVNGGALAGR